LLLVLGVCGGIVVDAMAETPTDPLAPPGANTSVSNAGGRHGPAGDEVGALSSRHAREIQIPETKDQKYGKSYRRKRSS